MVRKILDLHGNEFKVLNFKLCLEIPDPDKNEKYVFTRDQISGESFTLKELDKAYFYNLSMNLYVEFDLERVGYDEKSDIRKSFLYGKRYKKIP